MRPNIVISLYTVILAGLGAVAISHPPRPPLTGPASVIDGDTIIIHGSHIRLAAIDAPESDQLCRDAEGVSYACGTVASAYLKYLIGDQEVRCVQKDTDRYGRVVARCSVGKHDLGEAMVRQGYAIDYRRYDRARRYEDAEVDARRAKRGIWQGAFTEPEEWRRRR
jgi:endonuclease YncB( thermonuclease family)